MLVLPPPVSGWWSEWRSQNKARWATVAVFWVLEEEWHWIFQIWLYRRKDLYGSGGKQGGNCSILLGKL
jgi:hypothetical protein